ncbi:MAG: MBL fold metallo-hydrolase [Desulfobacterales bacterium]|nr:MBL fold metallo-hydrolase [Desulfobacterales bacterium]
MLIKQLIVGNMGVCCYLVGCDRTGEGLIIDPGGDEERILAACNKEKLTIRYIVNTHGHPDHVCGNARLKAATGAEIVMHVDEAAFIARPEIKQYFSMLGLPESPPPDRTVVHGDTIDAGTVSLKVLLTPGHTPGGICLYSAPNLFSGDTLFAGGVGRTDFPGGNTDQLLNSIREQLLTLPDDTVVWPGHGYGGEQSTIGAERTGNPFLNGGW